MKIIAFQNIKQKWNGFKSNLREYMEIRKKCSCALSKCMSLRESITAYYTEDEDKPNNFCIFNKILFTPNDASGSLDQMRSLVPFMATSYCNSYKGCTFVKPGCCAQKDCKQYSVNAEYARAWDEYNAMCDRRRSFWKRGAKEK